jgi:hypothetical protein
MAGFGVDIEALGSAGPRLIGVVSALSEEAHGATDGSVIGFDDGVSAFTEFVSGWSHGRSLLSERASGLQGDLVHSSGTYRQAETGLSATLRSDEAGGAR